VADEVWALQVDSEFVAVADYYETFSQTTDEQVLDLLSRSRDAG
jgi:predicted phosphoribosyltransferase